MRTPGLLPGTLAATIDQGKIDAVSTGFTPHPGFLVVVPLRQTADSPARVATAIRQLLGSGGREPREWLAAYAVSYISAHLTGRRSRWRFGFSGAFQDAVRETISWESPEGKRYQLCEAPAVLIVRPRGIFGEEGRF